MARDKTEIEGKRRRKIVGVIRHMREERERERERERYNKG